ncbi:MAG TPA: PqqD family protein [Bacilli bacterium]|nr:PqqD family protein [Bacilli bacterium]
MRIKAGFVIKEIAGNTVVFPVGDEAIKRKAIINLNKTGAFLWKELLQDITQEELVSKVVHQYLIDEELAKTDVANFINLLRKHELLE